MSEAPKEQATAKDSRFFNMAPEGEPEDLRDAWGRPANPDQDQAVSFEESRYMAMKVDGPDGLKAELKAREEAGRTFDKSSIKTKKDLVAALEADDAAQAQEAADEADGDPDGDQNPPA